MNAPESICNNLPYTDVVFSEPMASPPQIIVASTRLFPFTPCAAGASDAIDHVVASVTRFGFRLYGDRGNQRAQEPRYVEEIYPFEGLATG